jgi:exoribonuclease II
LGRNHPKKPRSLAAPEAKVKSAERALGLIASGNQNLAGVPKAARWRVVHGDRILAQHEKALLRLSSARRDHNVAQCVRTPQVVSRI